MAQPFPTKFKSVQITGSYKAVAKQLKAEGFNPSYDGDKMFRRIHEGIKSVLTVEINKDIDQVCSLTLQPYGIEKCSADEISEKFNSILISISELLVIST